jgi:hypothetical protein
MKIKVIIAFIVAFVIVGCTVPVVVQNPDGTTKTEHKIDPKLEKSLEVVGTIGGVVPQPWGWIVGAGAAAVGAITQTLASRKNRLAANAATTAAEKWEDIGTTIIQGVEAAGEAAAAVKESITARAKSDGNHLAVAEAVRKELAP